MAYTRPQVIRWLATASNDERLGLFVGTGFSMAATNNVAPSFQTLVERIALMLGLPADLNAAPYLRKSLPQMASHLIAELVNSGMTISDAGALVRRTTADLCNLIVPEAHFKRFAESLESAKPSWIITTNYDLILEALMEHGYTVQANQTLFPSNTQVPIYHLHGHRHRPDSIRITEEDYVSLLAPLDYQRLRLPLLFLESTTLLLGYGLGDINVRAAVEWSRSFTGDNKLMLTEPQGRVVQALYAANPSPDPREGLNGEIIIEISDIPSLLDEIGEEAFSIGMNDDYNEHIYVEFLKTLTPEKFAEPGADREEFLSIIEKSVGGVPVEELIGFLEKVTSPIWQKTAPSGAFAYYGEYLTVFLEVLKKLEYREANPKFIAYLARSLDKVGSYFSEEKTYGAAWGASQRWKNESPTLNVELLRELNSLAATNSLYGLQRLTGCSTLKHVLAT